MIDANPIGVIINDVHGSILDANDAFLHLIGYSRPSSRRDKSAGWTSLPRNIFQADSQASRKPAEGRLHAVRESLRAQGWLDRPHPDRVHLDRRSREEAIAFILDLTERKRAQAALESAVAEKSSLPSNAKRCSAM